MNVENTHFLLASFPNLFEKIISESSGGNNIFQVDDGWFTLIVNLSSDIQDIVNTSFLDEMYWPKVRQVKSKLGSIRYVVFKPIALENPSVQDEINRVYDQIRLKISEAYESSLTICEVCGKHVEHICSQFETLCSDHRQ